MKKPLILTTASNNFVENMDVVRLNHEYVNALVQAGGVPLPITSTFGLEELAALSDGLLLTGGLDVAPDRFGQAVLNDTVVCDPRRDELELALIRAYWQTGKPVLAICRGIQILNVAFGGTLIQDIPAWCGANHSGTVHPVAVREGSLLHRLTGQRELSVNSYHHQCIPAEGLAQGFVPTAVWTGSGVTVIEAMEATDRPALAVQWHPERAYLDPAHLTDMSPLFRWLVNEAK